MATRLILVKADGSVSVHADDRAYKPLNWMSPPCTLKIAEPDPEAADALGVTEVWQVRAKDGDTLHISLAEVFHDSAHELGVDPGLQKDGVEAHLQALLAEHPATLGDGLSAVHQSLALQPDVLSFDVRMPGQPGLDAAVALADAWPAHQPFPALVFVTAYDQYAVQAFEAQAVDYLLKPVQSARLLKTVQKLRLALIQKAQSAINSRANSEPQAPAHTQQLGPHPRRPLGQEPTAADPAWAVGRGGDGRWPQPSTRR